MNFDAIAPHYYWLERLCSGFELERCRESFLGELGEPEHVLIVGEGDGRFLAEFLRHYPHVKVTCVDASGLMLQRAERRISEAEVDATGLTFVQADIRNWEPKPAAFDLIVTHFVLVCFTAEELTVAVARMAASAAPRARWLLSDFCVPQGGLARWRARLVIRLLYGFFGWVAGLPVKRLTPPEPYLIEVGFVLQERRIREWGMLHADLWVRDPQVYTVN